MYNNNPESRSGRTGIWLQVAGVVIPILFALQGYLVAVGLLDRTRYISDEVFVSLLFVGLLLSAYCVLSSSPRSTPRFIGLLGLELTGIAFIVTTTGFATPLALAFVLLLYESYRIASVRGLLISSFTLALGVAVDIYRSVELQLPNVANTLLVTTCLIFLGLVLLAILRIQVVRQAVLEKSIAQAELERYRVTTLMNNLSQGVVTIDSKGIVRLYNAATLNILDTNDSLNGHHIDEVLHVKDSNGKRVDVFEFMKHTQHSYVRDDLFYHYSDDVIRLEISIAPISVGTRMKRLDIDRGFILMLRDITKQKNLDEERDEFISVVSHELRTPLTIAEGTLSNIGVMYEKGLATPERIEPALKAAHEQIVFLSRMVNDLSTLSRAERGVADAPEAIDARELLESLYHEYEPQAAAAGLVFNIDMHHQLGTIVTSRLYVSELLQNLITNAIKYTKQGSVTLKAQRNGDELTISVKDTGIGIGKADQKKIYDKFYRSEDYRTRETRGTGLGLYVAVKLARKIDTFITLKSRLNHGSQFSITLRVQADESANQ